MNIDTFVVYSCKTLEDICITVCSRVFLVFLFITGMQDKFILCFIFLEFYMATFLEALEHVGLFIKLYQIFFSITQLNNLKKNLRYKYCKLFQMKFPH